MQLQTFTLVSQRLLHLPKIFSSDASVDADVAGDGSGTGTGDNNNKIKQKL